jgi:hypothetical protein
LKVDAWASSTLRTNWTLKTVETLYALRAWRTRDSLRSSWTGGPGVSWNSLNSLRACGACQTLRTLGSRGATTKSNGPKPLTGGRVRQNYRPSSILTRVTTVSDKLEAIGKVECDLSWKKTIGDLSRDERTPILNVKTHDYA